MSNITDGATGLTDSELRELRDRASATDDQALRRLIAAYIMLRTQAAEMVNLIATREGGMTIEQTPLFKRLRELTQRER